MLQRSLYTVALAGTLLACGAAPSAGGEKTASAPAPAPKIEQPTEPQTPAKAADDGEGLFATITTRLGVIKCKLDYQGAPLTVANFVGLATGKQHNSAKPDGKPFYDGTIFHRVISGFMIQGGDPTGTGMGGPGYRFPDELDATAESYKAGYVRGAMAMANSGPNTNGSQFFIMHKDTGLPHSYSIFGKVVSGQEVVDAIATVPRNASDKPNEDVSMTVKIEAVGKAAKAFDAMKVLEANKAKFQQR
jgi:peptidyl-prolyl cis-trans isomerase A (cyclophilin A)